MVKCFVTLVRCRRAQNRSINGVTLIELIIALAMTASLTVSVYYFWNHINRHTITYTAKTQLTNEANRIITSIVSQVRSAKELFSFDYNSINFISKNGDTLNYRYDGDSLYLNNNSVKIITSGARISQFEIKNLNEGNDSEARYAYLEFTLTMQGAQRDTSTFSLSINAPRPTNGAQFW
ncbi:MAG: hypothetical protein JW915_18085 [Chitinispirillaceae bacterium]|nr:hypothetical protein [Chitinispirillaceae bacterium]